MYEDEVTGEGRPRLTCSSMLTVVADSSVRVAIIRVSVTVTSDTDTQVDTRCPCPSRFTRLTGESLIPIGTRTL